MDILIIGSGNEKIVEKIRKIADMEYDVSVHELDLSEMVKPLISAFRTGVYSSEYIIKLVRKIAEKELEFGSKEWEEKYGYPCDENEDIYIGYDRLSVATRTDGRHDILMVGDADDMSLCKSIDEYRRFISPSPSIDLLKIETQKLQAEMEKFCRKIHIKPKPDQKNIKGLSNRHNHRSKSIIKQSHINGKPIIYRRHGKDNRR